MIMGGFPYVVEAVGAPQSVTEALRAVAHRGTVLLLGAAGISEVDLTPIWYKEAALVGSIDHTVDAGSAPGLAGGPGRHSVDRALDILAAGLLPEVVVTHEFPLDEYRGAIETAIDRDRSHAIKVVFRPRPWSSNHDRGQRLGTVKIAGRLDDLERVGDSENDADIWPIPWSGPCSPWCTRRAVTPWFPRCWPRPANVGRRPISNAPTGGAPTTRGSPSSGPPPASSPIPTSAGRQAPRCSGAMPAPRSWRSCAPSDRRPTWQRAYPGHLSQAVHDHACRGRRGRRDARADQCRDAQPHRETVSSASYSAGRLGPSSRCSSAWSPPTSRSSECQDERRQSLSRAGGLGSHVVSRSQSRT